MWAKLNKSKTMRYVTQNFEEIWCNAWASLDLLDREQLWQIGASDQVWPQRVDDAVV
jgi:hypothetical protein